MKAFRISFVFLSLLSSAAFATDVDISLTNDSAKGQVNFFETTSDMQLGAGYTYHEGKLHIGNVDFHAQGRTALGNLPTTAGLGFRAIAWDIDNQSDNSDGGGAVGLGGFATVNIPDVPGLSFTGGLHYAPSILSFGDSEDMTSLELRASYRVIRNAEVFGGYRYLNTDLENLRDIHLDEGVIAGMKLFF